MRLQKNNSPKLNKILGGIYFVNNSSEYKLMIEPNIYFSINKNKLKYIKGRSNGFFNIFWSASIKSENELIINLKKNNEIISSKNYNSKFEVIISDEIIHKLSLNDELWIEIETNNEYLINSIHILVNE